MRSNPQSPCSPTKRFELSRLIDAFALAIMLIRGAGNAVAQSSLREES